MPQFSAAARPLLPVTIFCFTTIVFMRADIGIISGLLRSPANREALRASIAELEAGGGQVRELIEE